MSAVCDITVIDITLLYVTNYNYVIIYTVYIYSFPLHPYIYQYYAAYVCVCVFLQYLHSSQPIWSMLMESTHAEQQVLMKNLWLVISAIDQPEPRL